jgi:hypothetical protein
MELIDIIKELKNECVNLYNKLEKDEDGFVVFKRDILYLKETFYNRCFIREVTAIKFDEDNNLCLWEENREDDFSMGIYDESEYEIYSKLKVILFNEL